MILNFKEIPRANNATGEQDHFELFARDFLLGHGFVIIRGPDRGADGGKDLIVKEVRKGIVGDSDVHWLVSCKHHAHSGKAVSEADEPNIMERVAAHKCQGFLGFYSTLPTSGLADRLFAIQDKVQTMTLDAARIEGMLMESKKSQLLMERYFPKSFAQYSAQHKTRKSSPRKPKRVQQHSFKQEDLIDASKSAIIILEIEKIKSRYWAAKWEERDDILGDLYLFAEHNTIAVSRATILFLSSVSNLTRSGMTERNASSINFAVMNFYPYASDESEKDEAYEIARQCVFIGFNIAYDAFIHLRNLAVSMPGLSIMKFVYRMAKDRKDKKLMAVVHEQYARMEQTLNRPERTDLDNAKLMVSVFKKDLEEWDLSYPILPSSLYQAAHANKGKKR